MVCPKCKNGTLIVTFKTVITESNIETWCSCSRCGLHFINHYEFIGTEIDTGDSLGGDETDV